MLVVGVLLLELSPGFVILESDCVGARSLVNTLLLWLGFWFHFFRTFRAVALFWLCLSFLGSRLFDLLKVGFVLESCLLASSVLLVLGDLILQLAIERLKLVKHQLEMGQAGNHWVLRDILVALNFEQHKVGQALAITQHEVVFHFEVGQALCCRWKLLRVELLLKRLELFCGDR